MLQKKNYKLLAIIPVMIHNYSPAVCVGLLMEHTANPQSLIHCKMNDS